MQGKKQYQEKLFNQFQLSERIPKDNFYRRLKDVLDLDYLYSLTKRYYGSSGQKSIDPVVFFKLCLVGYLEVGLGKVNTLGLKQANKCMHLSAIAYNLKKYLKFIEKNSKSGAANMQGVYFTLKVIIQQVLSICKLPNFSM